MIKSLIFILTFIILTSCNSESAKKSSDISTQLNDSYVTTIDSTSGLKVKIDYSDSINYTDSNGWKQGKWIIRGWKDKIVEIKTYKNDTLHGLSQKLNGTPHDGNYAMGKREGYQYAYYENPTRLLSISYYENDSIIWIGFPAANEDFLTPIKHFHSTKDSIFISAPYENGKTWYEGFFCLKPSKLNNGRIMTYCYGLHKMYYRNGKTKGVVDYDNETIQEFDSLGNELYKAKFEKHEIHNQPLPNY